MANAGATFYITGVQLEKGSTATSFDYRPYGTELALCQRYYVSTFSETLGTSSSAYGIGSYCYSPATMRTNPTVTFANTTYGNCSGISARNITVNGASVYAAIITGGSGASVYSNVYMSAEL